jgi:hypothetical protein
MRVLNLTPHAIVVDNGVDKKTYEPSGELARVSTETTVVGSVDGFEIVESTVTGDNLPTQEEGTYLLVSAMVKGLRPDRKDLLAPNTGKATRNEKGHIVSVPGFIL